MPGPFSVGCCTGIQCPRCEHVHDATDNEIEGELAGSLVCEGCGTAFSFEADYTVTWYSSAEPPR